MPHGVGIGLTLNDTWLELGLGLSVTWFSHKLNLGAISLSLSTL